MVVNYYFLFEITHGIGFFVVLLVFKLSTNMRFSFLFFFLLLLVFVVGVFEINTTFISQSDYCDEEGFCFLLGGMPTTNTGANYASRVLNSPYPVSKIPTDVWVLNIGVQVVLWRL